MRQADLARPRRTRSSSQQPRVGDGVVRRAKRPAMQQSRSAGQQARDAVDLGRLDRFGKCESRQDAREALRQHGFARPGRADHQEIVRPRRRDLQRPLRHGLPAHLHEVGHGCLLGLRRLAMIRGGPEFLRPLHQSHDFGKMPHTVYVHPLHHRRLGRILERDHQVANALVAGANRHGERPANGPHRSIERQFAGDNMLVERAHQPHRAQDAERYRKIEPAALLAHAGRRQVDGDGLIGITETRVEHGRLDALAAFAHRDIGHSHHARIGRAAKSVQIDLDLDQMRVDAVNGSRAGFE